MPSKLKQASREIRDQLNCRPFPGTETPERLMSAALYGPQFLRSRENSIKLGSSNISPQEAVSIIASTGLLIAVLFVLTSYGDAHAADLDSSHGGQIESWTPDYVSYFADQDLPLQIANAELKLKNAKSPDRIAKWSKRLDLLKEESQKRADSLITRTAKVGKEIVGKIASVFESSAQAAEIEGGTEIHTPLSERYPKLKENPKAERIWNLIDKYFGVEITNEAFINYMASGFDEIKDEEPIIKLIDDLYKFKDKIIFGSNVFHPAIAKSIIELTAFFNDKQNLQLEDIAKLNNPHALEDIGDLRKLAELLKSGLSPSETIKTWQEIPEKERLKKEELKQQYFDELKKGIEENTDEIFIKTLITKSPSLLEVTSELSELFLKRALGILQNSPVLFKDGGVMGLYEVYRLLLKREDSQNIFNIIKLLEDNLATNKHGSENLIKQSLNFLAEIHYRNKDWNSLGDIVSKMMEVKETKNDTTGDRDVFAILAENLTGTTLLNRNIDLNNVLSWIKSMPEGIGEQKLKELSTQKLTELQDNLVTKNLTPARTHESLYEVLHILLQIPSESVETRRKYFLELSDLIIKYTEELSLSIAKKTEKRTEIVHRNLYNHYLALLLSAVHNIPPCETQNKYRKFITEKIEKMAQASLTTRPSSLDYSVGGISFYHNKVDAESNNLIDLISFGPELIKDYSKIEVNYILHFITLFGGYIDISFPIELNENITKSELVEYKIDLRKLAQYIDSKNTSLQSGFVFGEYLAKRQVSLNFADIEFDQNSSEENAFVISAKNKIAILKELEGLKLFSNDTRLEIQETLTPEKVADIKRGLVKAFRLFGLSDNHIDNVLVMNNTEINAYYNHDTPNCIAFLDEIMKDDKYAKDLDTISFHEAIHLIDRHYHITDNEEMEKIFKTLSNENLFLFINESNFLDSSGGHSGDNASEFLASFMNTVASKKLVERLKYFNTKIEAEGILTFEEHASINKSELIEIYKLLSKACLDLRTHIQNKSSVEKKPALELSKLNQLLDDARKSFDVAIHELEGF